MKTNRRDFLKNLGALALCSIASSSEWAKAAIHTHKPTAMPHNATRHLTILHTNDVHSHIDPFPADDVQYANLGGYARRKAYIDKVRNEGNETLVFECGDMFQGTPYFNFYKGKLEISLMNQMGIDAVTLGNHEFDNGLDVLCDRIEEAQFPFINTNYNFTNQRAKQLIIPHKIFSKCGIRIGVFGLGIDGNGLITEANLQGTTYTDPILVAQRTAHYLRHEQNCQMVIALTHIGYEMNSTIDDKKLAAQTSGIDLILGGHSHTFLPEPVIIKNKEGHDVVINQVGFGGINVGRIDVLISNDPNNAKNNKLITLNGAYPHIVS